MQDHRETPWLVLLHHLPAKPSYLRVKIGRRLQALGAVPLKNAVHALPSNAQASEAFSALLAEIRESGGDAILIEARLVAGQSDAELRAEFDAIRDSDYEDIAQEARRLINAAPIAGSEIERLRRRLADIVQLDFFGADGRQNAEAALRELEARRFSHPDIGRSEAAPAIERGALRSRIWVTRRGVHVDRIASAWLIRRFIDAEASFKFVDGRSYLPAPGELRFDMAEAEFTHEDDRCSFETLLLRGGPDDPALIAIGELIHELDIGDGKFDRPEAAGLGAMLTGICASSEDDSERIKRGSDALDQLHAYFSNRKVPR
ncbi:MAG: ChrB protein [Alphaproteobacteria bacterium]|nr:ChrB protein [Alphaproteobacteria bacterium]